MKILVIGNGFDIGLGFLTRYEDFLDFVHIFHKIYENRDLGKELNANFFADELGKISPSYRRKEEKDKRDIENKYCMMFKADMKDEILNRVFEDFHYCTYDNRWINYFVYRYYNNLVAGDNWIDIEHEIKSVIKEFENNAFDVLEELNEELNVAIAQQSIQEIIGNIKGNGVERYRISKKTYKDLRNNLRLEFDKFVMALGIYLDFFITKIKIGNTSFPDIRELSHDIKNVLCFNYVNNYNIQYTNIQQNDNNTCYVHGFVDYAHSVEKEGHMLDIKNLIEKNKMIIGFDEYLLENRKNDNLDFVYYRKYFQRISKGTGSQYIDWLNEYKNEQDNINLETGDRPNHVYIFGHSLDATDGDIFRDIFLRKENDTKVTIFYHDHEAHDRIIVNLIHMLSQKVLIEKTHGVNPAIEFRRQKETYIQSSYQ